LKHVADNRRCAPDRVAWRRFDMGVREKNKMKEPVFYEPADILIYVQDRGMVLKERSVVAFHKSDGKIVAVGAEAERMGGDTEDLAVVSPLRRGAVADYQTAAALFSFLLNKAAGKRTVLRPAVAISVPAGLTAVERKALEEVLMQAGAKKLLFSELPIGTLVREFPERYPQEYRKYKLIIGITKEEPERYVEERLKELLEYSLQEQIPQERVYELWRKCRENGEV